MNPGSPGGRRWRIGLTGGFGCGKSAVGGYLQELGAIVRDADDVAHDVMRAGQPAFEKVVERFGRAVVGLDGEIDRPALGRRVFADTAERRALEALVHPEVIRILRAWADETAGRGDLPVGIVPLLFEVDLAGLWDRVICVGAPEAVVLERLAKRGMPVKDARERIAAQLTVEEKMKRADYTIRNEGSERELQQATRHVWEKILKEERMRHAR